MTEQVTLTIASLLLVATMLVHSILGQRRVIRPLLDEGHGLMQRPLARFIVPFAWHLTSFIGLILAAILFPWAWAPDDAQLQHVRLWITPEDIRGQTSGVRYQKRQLHVRGDVSDL